MQFEVYRVCDTERGFITDYLDTIEAESSVSAMDRARLFYDCVPTYERLIVVPPLSKWCHVDSEI